MGNALIHLRVNKIKIISNRDSDEYVGRYEVPQAPNVGELINLDGNPYYVVERSWATAQDHEGLYCYLRVRA